jgi:formylglycine-generating enzyme required for sulfatase activity
MRYRIASSVAVMAVLAVAALGATPTAAQKRVALVIGNSAYLHTRALPNPRNDAEAIARLLGANGFAEVTLRLDLDYRALREAVRRFTDTAQGAEVALVYYAGHGLEVAGENYLVPVDAKLARDVDLQYEAVTLASVLDAVDGARKLKLVILDACRNNPLGEKMALRAGRTRSVTRGLARLEATGEVLVAYAAKAGTVAQDGRGRHSPYTEALLAHMGTPGLDVLRMFGRVKEAVQAATGRDQEPWIYGSPSGEAIALVPGKAGAPDPRPVPPPVSEVERAWAKVEGSDSIAVLRAFRQQYGPANALYDRLAEQRIAALEAAERKRAETELSRPGRAFRDCPEVCPEMVVVPAGSFTMGSPSSEEGRRIDEGPQRRVTIVRSFAVGKYEVTFNEWDACVAERGCTHTPYDGILGQSGWGRSKRPVINVSWDEITKEYLPWLSRKTGERYRLLTEAEWEYAARAGTATRYAFGSTISNSQAHFSQGRLGASGMTVTVGAFQANAFGLYDMHGNVWEWVQDCWHDSYDGAPSDGRAWTVGDCHLRVLRGGSWSYSRWDLRSAARLGNFAIYRGSVLGFRVARTLRP